METLASRRSNRNKSSSYARLKAEEGDAAPQARKRSTTGGTSSSSSSGCDNITSAGPASTVNPPDGAVQGSTGAWASGQSGQLQSSAIVTDKAAPWKQAKPTGSGSGSSGTGSGPQGSGSAGRSASNRSAGSGRRSGKSYGRVGEQEKSQRRRALNAANAKKSRQRRKVYMEQVSGRMRALEAQVSAYRAALASATGGDGTLPPHLLQSHLASLADAGAALWGEDDMYEGGMDEDGDGDEGDDEDGERAEDDIDDDPSSHGTSGTTAGGPWGTSTSESDGARSSRGTFGWVRKDNRSIPEPAVLGVRAPKRAREDDSGFSSSKGHAPWSWRTNRGAGEQAESDHELDAGQVGPVSSSLNAVPASSSSVTLGRSTGPVVPSAAAAAALADRARHMASTGSFERPASAPAVDSDLVAAMDTASASFIITDPHQPDNPIVWASEGFYTLTGYKADQVLGVNCRFLQGPGTDMSTVKQMSEALRAGKDFSTIILNYRRDGTPFWSYVSVTVLRDSAGRITSMVGVQACVSARNIASDSMLVKGSVATGDSGTDSGTRSREGLSQSSNSVDNGSVEGTAPFQRQGQGIRVGSKLWDYVAMPGSGQTSGNMLTAQQLSGLQQQASHGPSNVAHAVMASLSAAAHE